MSAFEIITLALLGSLVTNAFFCVNYLGKIANRGDQ